MIIVDFMIGTGSLSQYNYVCIDKNEENITELKEMGCTEEDIALMNNDEDNSLDIYDTLIKKGYQYSNQKGFYKDNTNK